MPELPDVEMVIKRIKENVVGETFEEIQALILDPIQIPAWSEFKEKLIGAEILGLSRRGKFILFSLSNAFTLIIHLRMTGNLMVAYSKEEVHKYTRVIFSFKSSKELRFIDQRKLGKMYIVQDENYSVIRCLSDMGPEPLAENFTLELFKKSLKKRKGKIKSLLMDQSFIAGIGNVYGDEILYQAKIHPERRANELNSSEINELYRKTKSVLSQACRFYDFIHTDKNWFLSGRRFGMCPSCNVALGRVKIQGRYSYFCPKCQTLG